MGEIIGGIIVMAIFIFFIMKKGKNKKQDDLQRMHENEYWAQKEAETPEVDSMDSDSRDD